MQRISHFFEKRIEHMLVDNEEECMNMISTWVVTDITYGKRYILTHKFDPPGDTAGRLQVEKGDLKLEEFTCFGDFLSIYSGKSVRSHLAGRSLFHHTYEDKYIERLNQHFMDIFESEYLTEEQRSVRDKLYSSFYLEEDELEIAEELEEFEVYLKSSVSNLLDRLKVRDMKWFYTKGIFDNKQK